MTIKYKSKTNTILVITIIGNDPKKTCVYNPIVIYPANMETKREIN